MNTAVKNLSLTIGGLKFAALLYDTSKRRGSTFEGSVRFGLELGDVRLHGCVSSRGHCSIGLRFQILQALGRGG